MKRVRLTKHMSNGGSQNAQQLDARLADTYISRLRGLLGKKQLADNDGLLLKRCASVHTVGMRYAIDLVFMDKKGLVLKCQERVKPFRAASAPGAYYTLELNNGVIRKQGISVDDQFKLEFI
ncbi:MAG: DUF192 domain-containing protein [Candidatus Thiodiazotropha sp.]